MGGLEEDGATLRRWRLARGWSVPRTARELIKAARVIEEPVATFTGLRHMINSWERCASQPSETYRLLYLRVFAEEARSLPDQDGLAPPPGEPANLAGQARRRAAAVPGVSDIDELEAAALDGQGSDAARAEIRTLAAEARQLRQRMDELDARLAVLLGDKPLGGRR
jgi:transcriptional regulator with XRE-family HTH domain